jgi:hypothetical protein
LPTKTERLTNEPVQAVYIGLGCDRHSLNQPQITQFMSQYLQPLNEDSWFQEPLNAAQIMRGFPYPWCVCGGWAIALFINQPFRHHKDIDLTIWRTDQLALRSHLVTQGWMLEKAVDGQLFPWTDNEFLELPTHTIWCNNPSACPSFIEVLLNERNERYFCFRRVLSITYPIETAILHSDAGIPILAPEIVLLYKAKTAFEPSNQADFEAALPHLEGDRRTWLSTALMQLYPGHDWLQRL